MQMQQVTGKPLSVNDLTLHEIVNDLIHDAAPLVVNNRNFVINNVPGDLRIEISSTIISSVLSKL